MNLKISLLCLFLFVCWAHGLSAKDAAQHVLGSKEEPEETPEQPDEQPDAPEPAPAQCVMSDWTDWSLCTGRCGSQIRRRFIREQPESVKECPPTEQVRFCEHDETCASQCIYSPWSDFEPNEPNCSKHRRVGLVIRSPKDVKCKSRDLWEKKAPTKFTPKELLFVFHDLARQHYNQQVAAAKSFVNQMTRFQSVIPEEHSDRIQKFLDVGQALSEPDQAKLDQIQELIQTSRPDHDWARIQRLQKELNETIVKEANTPPTKRPKFIKATPFGPGDCASVVGDTYRYTSIQSYVAPVSFKPVIAMDDDVF
eukprot:TRINITY_DN3064_c0_g2_i4.p1 TRINITY_DN3064_c0_g2~~TRINITY_DN3064_c0_g2_i4.p1  ORF type:complete len:310 (+),score=44.30 TRINITY_DN3064_c0_g2_i4:73-1002(+)